jgi:hypothetical protein
MRYFHVFRLLRRPKVWSSIMSMFHRCLHHVSNSLQTFCLRKATPHCSDFQGIFAQMCCKMRMYVRISWILILHQGKFRPFSPYTHFYQRKKHKWMLSITKKLKSIFTPILVLKFEMLTDFNGNVVC